MAKLGEIKHWYILSYGHNPKIILQSGVDVSNEEYLQNKDKYVHIHLVDNLEDLLNVPPQAHYPDLCEHQVPLLRKFDKVSVLYSESKHWNKDPESFMLIKTVPYAGDMETLFTLVEKNPKERRAYISIRSLLDVTDAPAPQ